MQRRLLGAIDQGTSSSRCILFDASSLREVASHQVSLPSLTPFPGWVELDPCRILESVYECVRGAMSSANAAVEDIVSMGITNQRETTIAWDRTTGRPLCNAILWNDARTKDLCDEMVDRGVRDHGLGLHDSRYRFQSRTGLPISTYFSAFKIQWMMQEIPEVRFAIEEGRCSFGTVDSWLIWNLTGGVSGGSFVTDVSNASRTMLLDIQSLVWSSEMLDIFSIPIDTLPTILPNASNFGVFRNLPEEHSVLEGISIHGSIGDQQGAMVGQMCFSQGQSKNTYGSGAFLLMNIGDHPCMSNNGLLTTVGYQMGKNYPPIYALEGSIAIAGTGVRWLVDNLNLIDDPAATSRILEEVRDTGGVYFVPAFNGLFAPHWREDARGTILGLSLYSKKEHIVRALLEAICYQTREILDAMSRDSRVPIGKMFVDGGMTRNDPLMQLQSDILGNDVERPVYVETTALGAAICAGFGSGLFETLDDVVTVRCPSFLSKSVSRESTVFSPEWSAEKRERFYTSWNKAIQRAVGWISNDPCA